LLSPIVDLGFMYIAIWNDDNIRKIGKVSLLPAIVRHLEYSAQEGSTTIRYTTV